ncbi:MAG: efflux RND transporter periplasmic adaptor subunit, partial [Maricaulaceae bacterium]
MKDEAGADIKQTLGIAGGKRKNLLTNPIVVLVIAGVAIGGFLFFYYQSNAPEGPRYGTAAIERGDLTVTVAATGELAPLNEVEISTEVSGRIEEVLVDNNDPVEVGQLLARLDTLELEAQVSRARASKISAEARIEEAQATLADAQRNVNRIEPLAARGVVTQDDLDNARSQFDRANAGLASARAQVEVATAELEQAEARLLKADIYSPVDGVVLDRAIEPGQTVAASMQAPVLFTLAESLEQMELKVA